MNTALKTLGGALILASWAGGASAQQTQAPTSAPAPAAAPAPAPAGAPKPSAQSEAGEPRANAVPAAGATAPAVAPGAGHPATKSAAAGPRGAAADRLNLNTATVTGDREQPKVMYIVPWKSSNIGDLSGKPMNSLLDEALAPVDREEFKREVAYYDAVRAETPQNGASPSAAKQGEK